MIKICNLRNEKPRYKYDVKVCRGASVLGNPWNIRGDESLRKTVCDNYDKYFNYHIKLGKFAFRHEVAQLKRKYQKHGKLRLFCWCAPKRCHAETIKKYILRTSTKKKKLK